MLIAIALQLQIVHSKARMATMQAVEIGTN
jgi:hypothetical protein